MDADEHRFLSVLSVLSVANSSGINSIHGLTDEPCKRMKSTITRARLAGLIYFSSHETVS